MWHSSVYTLVMGRTHFVERFRLSRCGWRCTGATRHAMTVTHTRLRNRIGWYAACRGLSDDALARRAGISRAHLNRVKNGRVVPRVSTGVALARALGVRVSELYHLR